MIYLCNQWNGCVSELPGRSFSPNRRIMQMSRPSVHLRTLSCRGVRANKSPVSRRSPTATFNPENTPKAKAGDGPLPGRGKRRRLEQQQARGTEAARALQSGRCPVRCEGMQPEPTRSVGLP